MKGQVLFSSESQKTNKVFEDICKISGVTFLKNGRYIGIRDYLKVKIWDTSNTRNPLCVVPVEESMKSKLCELFEQDCI